ncbi:hypothetical protein SDC9_206984 [bioreactor metagenome]|uniref:TRAP C4-dicarboxylate transport system permease DctM subunit domain-containing protein n=1 Tax=bioreactor metagenome TaxID=1076179 RepID=A0A645JI27_9ZZZZ
MATITAPIVIKLGVPMLAAHMFVFYFGIVADITPPVALAAYAGSAIAHSDPFKTGLTATRIAITAFIIPYIFAFNPDLLLIGGSISQAILILITAFIGMVGISAGMEGYMHTHLKVYERIVCVLGGIMLIVPGVYSDFIGILLVAIMVATQIIKKRKTAN